MLWFYLKDTNLTPEMQITEVYLPKKGDRNEDMSLETDAS